MIKIKITVDLLLSKPILKGKIVIKTILFLFNNKLNITDI